VEYELDDEGNPILDEEGNKIPKEKKEELEGAPQWANQLLKKMEQIITPAAPQNVKEPAQQIPAPPPIVEPEPEPEPEPTLLEPTNQQNEVTTKRKKSWWERIW